MMPDAIALDVAYTARQLDHMLEAYPELAEDETLRADVFDGETDLYSLMSKLVRRRQERRATIKGLKEYRSDLGLRLERLERADQGISLLMLLLMEKAQLPKVVLPEATVSRTKGRESLVIEDASQLPQGYVITETVHTPDKDAIKSALEKGDDIPGARLETGSPSITVRVR